MGTTKKLSNIQIFSAKLTIAATMYVCAVYLHVESYIKGHEKCNDLCHITQKRKDVQLMYIESQVAEFQGNTPPYTN